MPWSTSSRRDELPADWPQLRAQVKARARGICEWTNQYGKRCGSFGRECHHLGDKHDHSLGNLQWICTAHHKIETDKQAKAAQFLKYSAARKRPAEAHPGIRGARPAGL